ncbi:MAG: helix-turn-helix domain-containing protein [Cellvibrionaceae bacterium]
MLYRLAYMLLFMNEDLKTRLKAARKEAKLTQKEIVTRVGITQPAYSELETGKSASSSYLPQIARILGVDAHWLATGRGAKTPDGSADATNDTGEQFLPLLPINSVHSWLKSEYTPASSEKAPISVAMASSLGARAYVLDVLDDSMGMLSPKGSRIAIDPDAASEQGKMAVYHLPEHNETYLGLYMSRAGKETLKFLDGSDPVPLEGAVYCGKARILLAKEL